MKTMMSAAQLARRLVLSALAFATFATAQAASVLPLYLEEVIDNSTTAFEGTCTGNRTERDPATNLIVTYTSFAVHDVLKGSVGTIREIKQIGGSLPGEALQYRVEGIPTFVVGQDYVVFLAGVSSAGFSSPIGLEQGRFDIRTVGASRRVGNGRDFRDTTSRIAALLPQAARSRVQQAAEPVRDLDLDDFKQAVRNRVGGGR
jgi:hypothetical protein